MSRQVSFENLRIAYRWVRPDDAFAHGFESSFSPDMEVLYGPVTVYKDKFAAKQWVEFPVEDSAEHEWKESEGWNG